MMKVSMSLKILVALLPLALTYGCAGTTSSSQSGKGLDKTDQALATAQSALTEAKAAHDTAAAALAQAQAANAKADQAIAAANAIKTSGGDASEALAAANDAKRMAQQALDTSSKLDAKSDRMFQKAMRK